MRVVSEDTPPAATVLSASAEALATPDGWAAVVGLFYYVA
jgi:hypothetical protein